MASPPRTPSPTLVSPFKDGLSPHNWQSYLHYTYNSPSSPTPSSATNTHSLTSISPRQYQLAHPDIVPPKTSTRSSGWSSDTLCPSSSPTSSDSSYNRVPPNSDASDALNGLEAGLRNLRTLTAADTLLSIQQGGSSSPFESASYQQNYPMHDVPPFRWPWASSFDVPSPSPVKRAVGFKTKAMPNKSLSRALKRGKAGTPSKVQWSSYQFPPSSPFSSPGSSHGLKYPSMDDETIGDDEDDHLPSSQISSLSSFASPSSNYPSGSSSTQENRKPDRRGLFDYAMPPQTPSRLHSSRPLFEEDYTKIFFTPSHAGRNPVETFSGEIDVSPVLRQGERELSTDDDGERPESPADAVESPLEMAKTAPVDLSYEGNVRKPWLYAPESASTTSKTSSGGPGNRISTRSKDTRMQPLPGICLDDFWLAGDRNASPPPSSKQALENKAAKLGLSLGFDSESPLSSAPSSPRRSTSIECGQALFDLRDGFRLPLDIERPTRGRTRALASVLRGELNDESPTEVGSRPTSGSQPRKRRAASLIPESVPFKSRSKRRKSDPANISQQPITPTSLTNTTSDATSTPDTDGGPDQEQHDIGQRRFPTTVAIHPTFPGFYRKFAVPYDKLTPSGLGGATANPPRSSWDLYTPRWVRGRGTTKVGLCPICVEPPSRGGEGKKLWLSMKFSAFKYYHMQYAHGISPSTGLPFSPPTSFRMSAHLPPSKQGFRPKQEKTRVEEGKCHKCTKWVPVEGVKDVEVKVKEIFWWKHAAMCHQGSRLPGEEDIFIEDEHYTAAQAAEQDDTHSIKE